MDSTTLIIATIISLLILYFIIYLAIKTAISNTLEPYLISQLNVLKLMAKKSGIEIETIQEVTNKSDKRMQRTPDQLKYLDDRSLNYIIENCEKYSDTTIIIVIEEMKRRNISFSETQIEKIKMFIKNNPLLNGIDFPNL